MSDNLKQNMIRALTWNSVNVFGMQAVQVVIGIILARLLTPEMFGEVGVLFIFIGLGTVLTDGGFGQGLIRKKETSDADFSSIFWFNLSVSAVLFAVLFALAPVIAAFFSLPHLTPIARTLFLAVLLFPLYFIQVVKLTKEFQYKQIAVVNICSIFVSGTVAIIAALNGMGVWALVMQQLVFHLAKSVLFWFVSAWRPQRRYNGQIIRELWRFSLPMLGQSLLNVLFLNLYTVVIGRFYPIRQVGYFNQANKYSETVNAATQGILHSSTFPIFSRAQDNAPRLVNMHRRLAKSVVMVSFPVVALLVCIAEPLLVTLLSAKWQPTVVLFQLLLLANIFTPLFLINVNMLNARGESKAALRLEVVKKGLILLSLFVCFGGGIRMMLVGLIAANAVAMGLSMRLLKKSTGHYYRHQFVDFAPVLLLAAGCGAAVYFLQTVNPNYWFRLLVQPVVFVALYAAAVRLFYPDSFAEAKAAVWGMVRKWRKEKE